MNRGNVLLLGCLISLFSLISCASLKPIAEIEGVRDVDWELRTATGFDAPEANLNALKTGDSYYIVVKYLLEKKNGKMEWRELYNTEGLSLSVSSSDYTAAFPRISVSADPFCVLKNEKTAITVTFPSSLKKSVTKYVSVALAKTLPSFKGTAGENGKNGNDFDGPNGKDGVSGTDGQNLDLEIAHYSTKNTAFESAISLVLVREINTGKIWLLDAGNSTITIDAFGGSGGNGGKGSDRKLPKDSKDTYIKGGDGGDAGHGGRGGFVHVITGLGSTVGNSLKVSVEGGKAGIGGKGGEGENASKSLNLLNVLVAVSGVTDGNTGHDGQAGSAGRFFVENKELGSMFLGITSPLFDRSRLMP